MKVFKFGNMVYKYQHGACWQLVFRHDVSYGFFSTKEEASYNLDENKFSLLSKMSDPLTFSNFHSNRYEFLLEYPKEHPGEYNRWIQQNNPMKEQEYETANGKKVDGYTEIHADWTGNYWGGLVSSSSGSSVLDGSTYIGYWHFAIGDYCGEFETKTPGPGYNSYVLLWMRIADSNHIAQSISKCKNYHFFSLCILFLISTNQ